MTNLSATISFQSQPPSAQVFVNKPGSSEKIEIGKTPFTLKKIDLSEKINGPPKNGELISIEVSLPNYDVQRIFLPFDTLGLQQTELSIFLSPNQNIESSREILQRLHNAQKFAFAKQYERALIETDKVLEIDPKFPRALSMKGSIYYVQKNYKDALVWYDKALIADPSFDEVLQMINKIKLVQNAQ